jgi:hypothetical protein
MKTRSEYDNFTEMMGKLVKVPHSEVKAKLDAEKKSKMRKKARKSSVSRVAGDTDQLGVAPTLPVTSA